MCDLMNYTFRMDLYCGNLSYSLGLILALLHVAAAGQKTTQTAVRGDDASLECQTKTESCSDVEWHYSNKKIFHSFRAIHKEGTVLNNSNGKYSIIAESFSGKCVLVIKNVSVEDSGTYVCDHNGNELLKAELIVFVKYPSEQFCSISVRPNEQLLGSNVCHLPPDTIEASCAMEFTDNSDMRPLLEWSVDGRVIQANDSIINGNTRVSRVHVSAAGLRSSSSSFVCRVKYGSNSDIQTNLTWSIRLGVTSINETSHVTEVTCGQTIVNCSEVDDVTRSYSWVNAGNIRMSDSTQLDLEGKPMGIYSCVVTRSVRDKWCTYIDKRINFTCNESDVPFAEKLSGPLKSHYSVGIVLLCVVGVFVGIVACIVWMRIRRRRTRKNLCLEVNTNERTNGHLIADASDYEQQSQMQVASASND